MEKNINFKILKPPSINNRIKELVPLREKIGIWSDSHIWKIENEEFYSNWIIQEIHRLKSIIIEFVKDGYSDIVCEKYSIDYGFLRNLAFWIAKTENIISALFKTNGWKGQLGLETAQSQLKLFFTKNKKIPNTSTDRSMINIAYTIAKHKYWKEFGINSWKDLLIYTFGEEQLKKWKELEEQQIFDKAISELKKIYEKTNRLPLCTKDKEINWITSAIHFGKWKSFGISTWNDMLRHVFGEINVDINKYKGVQGLNTAVKELLKFHEKTGEKPTANNKEINGIYSAIYRGGWKKFGINTWNDFINHIFNKDVLNTFIKLKE